MKTTIEMHGYEITISEPESGKLMVQALKDGEVIEEFELEGGEDHPTEEPEMDGEDMGGDEEMSAFGEEEADLGEEEADQEMGEEESGEEMEEEEMKEEEGALESFSSFFNKPKKMKYRK